MRWACLLLPQLAMDVVLRNHPHPERALVLVDGPHARRRLYAVNEAARAMGLKPGMPLIAAQAIVDGFQTVEHDPAAVEHARGLLAEQLPPFVPASRDLFDPRPQQALPWAQLRERLRARLGDDGVQGLVTHPDHRPERAWRNVSGDTPVRSNKTVAPPTGTTRPGWLLIEPEPLREPFARILAGPERIESGWWDQGDVRRDYYLVETAKGQRAWAYRDAGGDGALTLHGWFA
jgi:nucleotidyltransferase/DNA polymerase involved in DNA repair